MNNIDEIKKEIQSCFEGLMFDEDSHTYTLGDGKKLTSTSSYISKFSDSFNSYWASEAKGKKILSENSNDRRTPQYYRKRWEYVRDEATNMGSRVHMFAECYPNFDTPMCNKEQGVIDFFNWIPKHYKLLFLELRVYDKQYSRAGTMDGLLYNSKTGKLVIFDFKTNSRNILECYANKKLKAPFNFLYATNLNKYSLQLSDYMNMLEKNTLFEVEERWIVWLRNKKVDIKDFDRNDKYKLEDVKPDINKKNFKIFKVKDYSSEIFKDLSKPKTLGSRKKNRKKVK